MLSAESAQRMVKVKHTGEKNDIAYLERNDPCQTVHLSSLVLVYSVHCMHSSGSYAL